MREMPFPVSMELTGERERVEKKQVTSNLDRNKKNFFFFAFTSSYSPTRETASFEGFQPLVARLLEMARALEAPASPGRRTRTTTTSRRNCRPRRRKQLANACRSLTPFVFLLLLCFAGEARSLPGEKGEEIKSRRL